MNNEYVQPPVSLPTREQIAAALHRSDESASYDPFDYDRGADAVLALIPQPAPTAEPEHDEACVIWTGDGFTCDCGNDDASRTEPPRIEDMAPGERLAYEAGRTRGMHEAMDALEGKS